VGGLVVYVPLFRFLAEGQLLQIKYDRKQPTATSEGRMAGRHDGSLVIIRTRGSHTLSLELLGPVWHSISRCELFIFCQTLFFRTASWIKLFFFSPHKGMSWDKDKKVAFTSFI